MSKFNTESAGTKILNKENAPAYSVNPEFEFVGILLTSFVEQQFYASVNEQVDKIANFVSDPKFDKKFAAQASVYARNEFGMRSITHVTATEVANQVKGVQWTARYFDKVIRRVDDMTEIVSYYLSKYGKPLPNALKKGLAQAFNKFDAYQLAKYRAEGKAVSLVDVVNLVHPTPNKRNAKALELLVKGDLKSMDTWEAQQTKAGQTAKTEEEKKQLKKESWVNLVKERKIGYFALLKNLRNIMLQAPEVIEEAVAMLTDEKLIRKSLVLPFRFVVALDELSNMAADRRILSGLEGAINKSFINIPKFEGKTLIALDDSGSMTWGAAQGWTRNPVNLGALFAAALYKSNNADFMKYSNSARYYSYNDTDAILTIQKQMMQDIHGGGTNAGKVLEEANQKYDRIIFLTDEQTWGNRRSMSSLLADYKAKFNADPHIYTWDLQHYGSMMFPERQVYALAGFSEKAFDIMKMLETDRQALVNVIKKVVL